MADLNTIRTAAGRSAAQIDEGLRAHMNKVYATMSGGMLITALAARRRRHNCSSSSSPP